MNKSFSRNRLCQEDEELMMDDSIETRLWGLFGRFQWLATRYMTGMRKGAPSIRDASRGQGRVLTLLKLTPEISQKDLTVLLDMRQQSLGELLAKLEKKGFIEREPSEDDRRKVIVRLTDAGRAEAKQLEEQPSGEFAFFDCLDEQEKDNLADYLIRITEQMETMVDNSDERGQFEQRRRERERFFEGGLGGPGWHDRGPRTRR